MILSKISQSIVCNLNNKVTESSKSVKRLELAIDSNWISHFIQIIYSKWLSVKIKGLGRIRTRLSLFQAKIL